MAWSVSIYDQFQYGIGVNEKIELTFVAREPAVSLSRNTGIAKGPKEGVAFNAPLKKIEWASILWDEIVHTEAPSSSRLYWFRKDRSAVDER